MRRFKNILFVNEPGTADTTTPTTVIELARANGAKVTICDVAYELARSFQNLRASLKKLRQERLEALLVDVDTSGVEVELRLLTGAPFVEVIRQVERAGHDLVIKNAEPGGLTEKRFGANDMHLMRKCPCPLWIAQGDRFGRYTSIVAAVDVDPELDTNAELNALILDLSTSLARQSDCDLHVAHAPWVHNETLLQRLGNGTGGGLEGLLEDRRERLEKLLAERDLDGLRVQIHLDEVRPADHVIAVARKVDADLVVMGTLAHMGIPGFFIGNTAERILSGLSCSALTVKPSGFHSPVV